MIHSLVDRCALQGMADLAVWIVNDCANLETEVHTKRMFRIFAKQKMNRLLAKEIEVESYLE